MKEKIINSFFEKFEVLEKMQVKNDIDYSVTRESVNKRARNHLREMLSQYPIAEIAANVRVFDVTRINDDFYYRQDYLLKAIEKLNF